MSIDKPAARLEFLNPEFGEGIKATVRLGEKWRDWKKGKVQPFVPVFQTGEEELFGRAEITGVLYGQFSDMAQIACPVNHDESCQTEEGLVEAMIAAYGDDFDAATAMVTVVFFKFYPQEEEDEEENDEESGEEDAT